MKRIISSVFFTIVLIHFSTVSHTQNFVAGPKLGIAFTQVDGDSYAGFHKVGLNLGGFVYRSISKNERWDLQFEIEYIQKGSRKYPDVEMGDYTEYKISLNYIQFPLFLRFNANHFSFEGGVSIGALLSTEELSDGAEIPEDVRIPFKTMEYASIFSVNYHFTKKLWLNARYSYSFARIRIPYNGEIPVYDPHWDLRRPGQYNNLMVFSLYYAFGKDLKL